MPTVSEVLSREFPEEFQRMSAWRARLFEAEAEQPLSAQRLDRLPGAQGRAVMAVGLSAWGAQEAFSRPVVAVAVQSSAPAVLVLDPNGDQLSTAAVTLDAFEALAVLRDLIGEILGLDPRDAPRIIGMPRPVEQVAPGQRAFCGGGPASFGSPIFTGSGARGILTAGHAAPTVPAGVYDPTSSLVGTVTNAVRCSSVGAGVATADIATIELASHVLDTVSAAPKPTGLGQALLWDKITAYGAQTSGQTEAIVMTGAPFAGPSPSGGNFGEATVTAYAISAPGDSGAPAFNQRDELVGHIVAGNPGIYSIVQDATYQLRAFGATLR